MSSFVPHPLPSLLHSVTEERLQNNEQPSTNALRLEDSGRGIHSGGGLHNEEEVIMIDDISSNEGITMENESVTMEHSVNTDVNDQTVGSIDGSHGSTHIDLDQDDDIAIALEKFVDQSSDDASSQ